MIVNPSKCVAYLLQHSGIQLCFRKILTGGFIRDTRITDVPRGIAGLFTPELLLAFCSSEKFRFKFEQLV
jgi:hypothetical protein